MNIEPGAPRVSVVLPTYNRKESLARVFEALARQSVPFDSWEAVVVSDGSADGTDEWLLAQRPPFALRVVQQRNQGVAAARNNGIAQARGEIILFIDDDLVPTPELMAEHLRMHESRPRAVVMGPMLPPPDEVFPRSPWVRWEEAMLEKQYQAMLAGIWKPTPRQFYTGNTSLRREEIVAAGGFDPSFKRAEDVELGYRLADRGMEFHFNPAAKGLHYAERSFASWCRIPYLYGRYDVVMTYDKGQKWLLPTIMGEFRKRNLLIRILARLCLGHPKRVTLVAATLSRAAFLGDRAGIKAVPRYAYSGVFNLLHYMGICDQLGDVRTFWRLVAERANRDGASGLPFSAGEGGKTC